MSNLAFRNSHGNLVEIPAFAATQVKNEFGAILEKATHGGAVAITRHNLPKAVLLSYEEFDSLIKGRARSLDDIGAEFDALLLRMQTRKSKSAMKRAFEASPAKLGRAARKAARKTR